MRTYRPGARPPANGCSATNELNAIWWSGENSYWPATVSSPALRGVVNQRPHHIGIILDRKIHSDIAAQKPTINVRFRE
jgi:hypothetical protein